MIGRSLLPATPTAVTKRDGWSDAKLEVGTPLVWPACLAFAVIELALFPKMIAIKDESIYLAQAYVFRAETIFANVARIPLFGVVHSGHVVAPYPPGESLLLLPATLANWRLAFLVPLVAHIVGTLLFGVLLTRLGLRREWALLYLFFPPMVLFSRTLMAETVSATLTVAGLILYFRGTWPGRLAAGIVFGVLALFRYINILTAILLILCLVMGELMTRFRNGGRVALVGGARPAVSFALGLLPGLAFLFAYDWTAYGRFFGYGTDSFSISYVPAHLAFYGVVLLLLWPLMVLGPLVYRGPHRLEFTVIPYVFLLAMSSYYYVDDTHGALENLLAGARLLIPVFPFWLVTYAWGLDRVVAAFSIRHFRPAVLGLGIIGAALTVAISAIHQRHLEGAAAVRSAIYGHTSSALPLVINIEAAKFISPAWGNRLYTFLASDPSSSWADHGSQIVVTTQLGSTERNDDWQAAQQLARETGDVLVLDRVVGDWRVGIWEPVSKSESNVVP